MSPFRGLSAFPITPADENGRVDTDALSGLVERLCGAGVDSIGLLGSTGTYAYLTREERHRALEAAAESGKGRTPIMVGIGALRTDYAQNLAKDAQAAGADALLLAPVSYTPLTQNEVHEHFRSVAEATDLPVCIYNNPGTTHFSFSREFLQRLDKIESVQAVKMPLPANGNFGEELADLRSRTSLSVGYSGDWGIAEAMLGEADAFYSVLAGLLPAPVLSLARAAQAGDAAEAKRIDETLQPPWTTFKAFGSLRVMYVLQERHDLGTARPPRPILPLEGEDRKRVEAALEGLLS